MRKLLALVALLLILVAVGHACRLYAASSRDARRPPPVAMLPPVAPQPAIVAPARRRRTPLARPVRRLPPQRMTGPDRA